MVVRCALCRGFPLVHHLRTNKRLSIRNAVVGSVCMVGWMDGSVCMLVRSLVVCDVCSHRQSDFFLRVDCLYREWG